MIFDALVVGYIRANLARAMVSIVAIALGVATALTLWQASSFTLATLDSDRALFTRRLDFQIAPYANAVPEHLLGDVRYLDGVESAEPTIDRPVAVGVDPKTGTGGLAGRLLGVDLLQPLPGVTGFEEGLPGPFAPVGTFIDPAAVIDTNGAIVSAQTATRLHLRRGDRFTVLAGGAVANLRVANVLPATVDGVDSSVLFVDITTAQKLFALPHAFDRIDIVTSAPAKTVRPQIVAALAGRARLVDPSEDAASLGNLTAGIDATFGGLAAIALAIGGLLVFNAVGTSIAQRRADIGTLRALGVAPSQIVTTFVCEGAAYGALGAMFGLGLGTAAVDVLGRVAHAGTANGSFDIWPIVGVFALGVAVAVASSILPALAAVGLAPALAARQGMFEGGSRAARSTLFALLGAGCIGAGIALGLRPRHDAAFVLGFPLSFALGGAFVIPAVLGVVSRIARTYGAEAPPALRLAALTFGAIPQRVGIAIAALAIATYAAVAFDVTSTSFERALAAWADRAISGDLIVTPAGNLGAGGATFDRSVAIRTQATPGVRTVAAIRTIHTRSGTTDVALRGEDDFAPVPRVETTEAPAMLSSQLAATLHVRRGDTFAVDAPHRALRLRVVDVNPDFSDGRGAIVVARGVLRTAFGDERIDALRVTVVPHADPAVVRDAVARRLAPLRLAISTTREARDRLEGVFAGTFAFARALGGVVVAIAVLGIVSTLAALVFERRFELRTLRRIGAARATIGRMLLFEAFGIAIVGSSVGLLLGLGLAEVILSGSDPATLGFALPIAVPLGAVGGTIVASIVASLLGTTFSLPAAFRIETDRA